jgi:Tol biopolymer transport system component
VVAAAALAAVVLSACGSSGVTPVSSLLQATGHGPGTVLFVSGAPSHGLGVDNTDLLAATPNGRIRDLTSSAGAENAAAWSPDGTRVVFARYSTTGHENGAIALESGIYTWAPGHGAPQRIASCPDRGCGQSEFAWSPNDRQLAFVSENGAIEVMNADGSEVHTVCDAKRCGYQLSTPLWSPDGLKLVFSNEGVSPFRQGTPPDSGATGANGPNGSQEPAIPTSKVWIANADGSGVQQLTQPTCKSGDHWASKGCAFDAAPAWSPDGKLIAFRRDGQVEVMDADGSNMHSLYNCTDCALDPRLVWTPDGKAVAYPANESFRITTLAGKTTEIRTCRGSRCVSPEQLTWSPSGEQLAFFADGSPTPSDVWVIGRGGEAMHQIAAGADNCCLAWAEHVSMRGAKAIPKLSGAGHLHLSGTIAYDTPASTLAFLPLGTNGHERYPTSISGLEPAWSPNGREIAFAGGLGGQTGANIYVADRNGGHVRVLTHFENGAGSPAWSPDGRTIAFYGSDREAVYSVWLVSATGGHIRRVADTASIYQSWNPSGTELLFSRGVGSGDVPAALFTIRPDGSGLRRLTKLPGTQDWAAWSPDGKEIVFDWMTEFGNGLYLIRPDGTHLRRLSTAPMAAVTGTWSPDSRYLALTGGSQIRVIDVKTGRFSPVATVPEYSDDPSWTAH